MNQLQQQHMTDIQTKFVAEHTDKYTKGTIEHKTVLNNDYDAKQMLAFLKEEVLDLVSYIYTLEELLEKEDGKPRT